ncbi:MAG: IS1380 family transposase [Thiolinea sp.]
MQTQCTSNTFSFHKLGRRQIEAAFDGGQLSTDSGGLLLRETERHLNLFNRLSACFTDYRQADAVEHPVSKLLKQRIYGLALGYEDLNDHDELRHDPLLAVLCDHSDPEGKQRRHEHDRGKALAGKSTLNRLELTPSTANAQSRYQKIVADHSAIGTLLVDLFLESRKKAPKRLILDMDATDDKIHGEQEGRHFNKYYDSYCYIPLYIFCGDELLCSRLQTAKEDAAINSVEEISRLVSQIRQRWPRTKILVRGDGGFCRDDLMSWCEENQVDYLLGLPKNSRLLKALKLDQVLVKMAHQLTGASVRTFREFRYRTQKSWSRERRVIGKAVHSDKGDNPRFVVTTLGRRHYKPRKLYEQIYCARGEMENRIKEQQLDLFADRTSTHHFRSNQLRLYFTSFAYVLIQALRRIGLKGTKMAKAQSGTIRLKLLKLAGRITVSVRRVRLHLNANYPYQALFRQVWQQLQLKPLPG